MYYQPNEPMLKPVRRAFVHSIKKTKSFKSVYNTGRQGVNPYFVMYAVLNNTDATRLGISVSKKVGKAVVRNRVKRLVKEVYRLNNHRLVTGLDIVVVARPAAGALPKEGSFYKFNKALESLLYKMKLIKILV